MGKMIHDRKVFFVWAATIIFLAGFMACGGGGGNSGGPGGEGTMKPVISVETSSGQFNPYSDDPVEIKVEAGSADSDMVGLSGKIVNEEFTVIRGLRSMADGYLAPGSEFSLEWDGSDDNGNVSNQGEYYLLAQLETMDGATSQIIQKSITIIDDLNLTESMTDSTLPILVCDAGNDRSVLFVEGFEDQPISSKASCCSSMYGSCSDDTWFALDHEQVVTIIKDAVDWCDSDHYLYNEVGECLYHSGSRNGTWSALLPAGRYRLKVKISCAAGSGCGNETKASYADRGYYEYPGRSQGDDPYANWTIDPIPTLVEAEAGDTTVWIGSAVYQVYVHEDDVYFRRGDGVVWKSSVRLTAGEGEVSNPTLCVDPLGKTFAAWQDRRTGYFDVFFQQVPVEQSR